MKILAIRGKNLASLEGEFTIDFTSEPLKSAGIYSITGPTGSGKSTILDALCLALFDNTPRTHRANENVQIPDVPNKTISQKDSRTILRRGTGEGYAEVDFIALTGDSFRSIWMVKRARGKAGGSLQNSEIRLTNLSTGAEVQGRKTELLIQISRLIGLSFDQFTRAVLLAQGDFSTFLKARQPEKAELLEKLTGTDIYSRISITIYEKSKEAEQQLSLLEERIRDIELLPEEKLTSYLDEKKEIDAQLTQLKKESALLAEKIKWIGQNKLLKKEIEEGKTLLNEIQFKIKEAEPRYQYISRIDDAQEIRDTYNEWKKTNSQLAENQISLEKKQKEQQENFFLLSKAQTDFLLYDKEYKKLEDEIDSIEPEIIKARELDTRIKGSIQICTEAKGEFNKVEKQKISQEKNISNIQKEISTTNQSIEELTAWFKKYTVYAEIFVRTDFIINLLNDAQSANDQQKTTTQLISQLKELLINNEIKLQKLQLEAEQLDKLLPAEISKLRRQLQQGMPCPVCGSTHHPLHGEQKESRLQEEELNKAKEENAKELTAQKEIIENRKNELTRLQTLLGSYQKQSADAIHKSRQYLDNLPGWEEAFQQGSLQSRLQKQAKLWDENTKLLTEKENGKSILHTRLKHEEDALNNIHASLEDKKKKKAESEKEYSLLSEERKKILQGESIDKITERFTERKKEIISLQKNATDNLQSLTAKNETYRGAIGQIEKEITRLSMLKTELHNTVEEWVKQKEHFTDENLADLLAKSPQWISSEKQFLNNLKETETISKARLDEREKNYQSHQIATVKPENEYETEEFLLLKLGENEEQVNTKSNRNTEIELALASHHKGKEKIKEFEQELTTKRELANNWKKLNELLGSATGSKFKEIAQGYTLEALLSYSNIHLKQLSDRYLLQRIPNTLALQIVDTDMLNEVRTVHSLSGGESFLVSLALALGLSSLSSNRMKVESLFIDEGFGSLDMDTLRVAMDALERLQTQGRKIGVISHVPEMTERISAQIRVIKTANGKSKIQIKG